MGKTRDIANILGVTEANNTQNSRIADDSNDVTTLTTEVVTSLIGDAGTDIISTEDSLPSNAINGKRAFVTSNQKFFVYDSPDWLNTLLINSNPTITMTTNTTIIDSNGGTIVVTITDSDFDQNNVIRSLVVTPSNITDSSITISGNYDSSISVLTISYDSDATSLRNANFNLTASVNDGISVVSDSASLSYDVRGQSIILSANATNVNEGDTVTYTLNTTGLENETINYTISGTGVTSADLSSGSLTGGIIISSEGVGSLNITFANDFVTEGNEVFTLSIDAPHDTISTPSSVNVTVADTSLTPTVTVNRSASSVNEGSTCYFSCVTANIPNNYRLYYKLGGITAADISSPTISQPIGSEEGYLTVSGNAATSPTYTIANDLTTEGGENFYFYVTRVANTSGTTVHDINPDVSNFITINDTSVTHPQGVSSFTVPGGLVGNSPPSVPYSWTVPANTTDIAFALIGGGGGGAGSHQGSYGGGGGGGGAVGFGYIHGVSAGTSIPIEVGRGASGGSGAGAPQGSASGGYTAGASKFSPTIYAFGGQGGATGAVMSAAAHAIGGNWQYSRPPTSYVPSQAQISIQHSGAGGAGGGWGRSPAIAGESGGGGGGAGARIGSGNNSGPAYNLPTSPDGYTGTGGEDGGGSDGIGNITSGGGASPYSNSRGGNGGSIALRYNLGSYQYPSSLVSQYYLTLNRQPNGQYYSASPNGVQQGAVSAGQEGRDYVQPGNGQTSGNIGQGGGGGGANQDYYSMGFPSPTVQPNQVSPGTSGSPGYVIIRWGSNIQWT